MILQGLIICTIGLILVFLFLLILILSITLSKTIIDFMDRYNKKHISVVKVKRAIALATVKHLRQGNKN